jgi:hypothetical protein|tara:strand:- start:830 stop:1474 length:645 start_codon:yes stop_codon:yes gene_type:complete
MKLKTILGILLVGTMFAINDGPVDVTASGIVPFVVSFNTAAGGAGGGGDVEQDATTTAGNFAEVIDDDYDQVTDVGVTNFFDIPNIIAISDFDANHWVKCYLTKGVWTIPSGYEGNKKADATDATELVVLVNVTAPGNGSYDAGEGLHTVGDFTSTTNYQGLDETANLIIEGGLASHGVENGVFDIDGRVLFDWLTDIPGQYSVALTLTVTVGS